MRITCIGLALALAHTQIHTHIREVFKMSMVETSTGRNTDTETPTGRNTDMVETPTWSKHRQVEI